MKLCKLIVLIAAIAAGLMTLAPRGSAQGANQGLDQELAAALKEAGFTGTIEGQFRQRLGRPINRKLADLGRHLFFDTLLALGNDNSCAGCHSPANGFGDSQSIAIGIGNNGLVGPNRSGPRNQRRSPMLLNNVLYPTLMWNSRFAALSGDPFDNSGGFQFPAPEGRSLSGLPHLLTAQAFIPPTERPEMAGFGPEVPGTNDGVRAAVLDRVNRNLAYRQRFLEVFPQLRHFNRPITYPMLAQAIAEFEFTLVFASAPIDRFARGQWGAMTEEQKRGALLFFGKAGCVSCHAVSGQSNEMFSDFKQHAIGVPQVAPAVTNVAFDGPGADEDFGLEQVTGDPEDRYKFRTSPLRNVALQPTFFHNGAFTSLADAVRHHLNVQGSARSYTPHHLPADLRGPIGPLEPVLARVDPLLANPISLTEEEVRQLVEFVGGGLLDERAKPEHLRTLIPKGLPSRRPVHEFE